MKQFILSINLNVNEYISGKNFSQVMKGNKEIRFKQNTAINEELLNDDLKIFLKTQTNISLMYLCNAILTYWMTNNPEIIPFILTWSIKVTEIKETIKASDLILKNILQEQENANKENISFIEYFIGIFPYTQRYFFFFLTIVMNNLFQSNCVIKNSKEFFNLILASLRKRLLNELKDPEKFLRDENSLLIWGDYQSLIYDIFDEHKKSLKNEDLLRELKLTLIVFFKAIKISDDFQLFALNRLCIIYQIKSMYMLLIIKLFEIKTGLKYIKQSHLFYIKYYFNTSLKNFFMVENYDKCRDFSEDFFKNQQKEIFNENMIKSEMENITNRNFEINLNEKEQLQKNSINDLENDTIKNIYFHSLIFWNKKKYRFHAITDLFPELNAYFIKNPGGFFTPLFHKNIFNYIWEKIIPDDRTKLTHYGDYNPDFFKNVYQKTFTEIKESQLSNITKNFIFIFFLIFSFNFSFLIRNKIKTFILLN